MTSPCSALTPFQKTMMWLLITLSSTLAIFFAIYDVFAFINVAGAVRPAVFLVCGVVGFTVVCIFGSDTTGSASSVTGDADVGGASSLGEHAGLLSYLTVMNANTNNSGGDCGGGGGGGNGVEEFVVASKPNSADSDRHVRVAPVSVPAAAATTSASAARVASPFHFASRAVALPSSSSPARPLPPPSLALLSNASGPAPTPLAAPTGRGPM